jgi:AcrR family transcriptional regulator
MQQRYTFLTQKYNAVIKYEVVMDTPKGKNPAESRKKVIRAATAIIREKGIDALSMRTLANESKLALRTLYNLYENKENVIIAVFEQGTRIIEDATVSLQKDMGSGPWKTAFYEEWIGAIEAIFLENQALLKPSIIAGFSLGYPCSEKLTEIHNRRIRMLGKTLEMAAERDLIWADLDLATCANLTYHNYFNVVLRWARGEIGDRGLVVHGRYAVLTILHTLINEPGRRENTLNLLRGLKDTGGNRENR